MYEIIGLDVKRDGRVVGERKEEFGSSKQKHSLRACI